MAKLLIAASAVLVAGLSVLGWGRAFEWMIRSSRRPLPVAMAVGLAFVLAVGGVLNLARCASPAALDAVGVTGAGLAVAGAFRRGARERTPFSWACLAAAVPLLATGAFLAERAVPPTAYNIHDDLEKYFAYPVKMLETGTLSPNPLGSLGAETLGGQAFLQAFVAAHAPLPYLGAVDGLFCRLLCVALAGFAVAPRKGILAALAAEAVVVAVNPQIVNISSVFSGAALMMAAFFIAGMPARESSRDPPACELGLLYAGAAALKTTHIVFAGVHFAALLVFGPGPLRSRVHSGARILGFSALFLGPWAALHLPLYLASGSPAAAPSAAHDPLSFNVFLAGRLAYGATQLHYTAAALAGLAAFGIAVGAARRSRARPTPAGAAAAAAGLTMGLSYCVLIALSPLTGRVSAIRYACPIVIAALPVLVRSADESQDGRMGRRFRAAALSLGVATVACFLPSSIQRFTQIAREGDEIAYLGAAVSPYDKAPFFGYTGQVFSDMERSRLADIQALVPAGAPMAAWVMEPFWLNFRRNPVYQTEIAGLAMRWARVPPGVHYFLVEYRGFAVRTLGAYQTQLASDSLDDRVAAARALDFLKRLNARAASSEILYDDGTFALMRADGF